MRSNLRLLASTTALGALALACTTSAHAQAPAANADAAADAGSADIVVIGVGQARQVQVLTTADIDMQTPGTSPLKVIDKLPGVNFQSADPFGNYEWSTSLSIRGFNQNQLGFTLDGVPLGDMSYGNHNGLHISRALISENTGRVEVAQGAGALSAPSSSNLGGVIEFFTRGPKDSFAVEANGTYGSENTIRTFARLDSGALGDNGPRASLSYAFYTADKWKGDGKQRQHQVNARIEQALPEGRVFGFVNFSDRRENDYQDLSLNMIRRLGYNWDNFAKNWDLAVRVAKIAGNIPSTGVPTTDPTAGTVFPAPILTADDAYYDASGLRRDWLAAGGYETKVGEAVTLKGTAYYHNNKGAGLWFTPYAVTPGGAPMTIRTTEYKIDRWGMTGSIAYETGPNRIEIGGWYEDNKFHQARRFYGLANTTGAPSRSSLDYPTNPLVTQWEFDFKTRTYQYHVQDTLSLGQLTVNLGWKGLKVTNRSTPVIAATLATGKISARDWFLPQVGATYKLSPDQEIFAGYSENMRAYASAATGASPFATTQAGFNGLRLQPEKSGTWELGYRFKSSRFQGVLAAYYVDFKNRIVAFANGAGIVGNPSILNNVGRVRSYGFEAAGTYRITPEWSLFASYAYNNSKYRDNVVNAAGTVVAATKDKFVVNAPESLGRAEVSYDDKALFGRIAGSYTSRRFYSYINDASVPGYVTFDASLGYRFDLGGLKGLTLEATASNLFDKRYVSTLGTNGFPNSDPTGDAQTLLAAAPRQIFVTLKTQF